MRYILLGLLIVVLALVGVKWAQVSALVRAGEAAEREGPPPESVSTAVSREMTWENTLTAVGSITAVQGVAVANELPGTVTRIHFDSGQVVERGALLVELDTRVERAQLRTAEARQKLAQENFARTRELAAQGGLPRSQLDADRAALDSATADVAALQAQIARKVVRAPFAGRLGIRAVNLGQYLSPGTTVTTLESLDRAFVDFTLPQQALPNLKPGLPIRASIEGKPAHTVEGEISAIDPRVDPTTRSIQVRGSLPNEHGRLRPGMFANVTVELPGQTRFVIVPATAIAHAPYGDSVFVLEAPKNTANAEAAKQGPPIRVARQQFVRIGEQRGDFVAVLEGLAAGKEVVTSGAFKLRNEARVVVNNRVKPKPELAPEVENR